MFSCTTVHSYVNQNTLHRLTERDSCRLAHFSAHEILNKKWPILNQKYSPRRNFAHISLNFRDLHFGLFLGLGLLLGYLATSNVKSDVGFLLGDPNFLLGRRNFAPISLSYRDPYLGLFGGFGFFWGYVATSNAKSDVGFLLGDPNFR